MRTLMLIPSVRKTGITAEVVAGRHPRMDYDALYDALSAAPEDSATLLDYSAVDSSRDPWVRIARRCLGRDVGLAALGFSLLRGGAYDCVFSNGENIALPLALMLKTLGRRRPGHVTVGHRLTPAKKRPFFRQLKVQAQIDTILVYASTQERYAQAQLGIPAGQIRRIAFHADTRFWRPQTGAPEEGTTKISSAGLEWRDYPTLVEAVRPLTGISVRLAAASPWSKHTSEVEGRTLPSHVEVRPCSYSALRDLYDSSSFVVVPLYENDFQAGVTTLLEAMATGKAVIVTQTTGQTDVIRDGENGLTLPPGDVEGWRKMILRLAEDDALRHRLGEAARRWVEQHATLEEWVGHVTSALRESAAAWARGGMSAGADDTGTRRPVAPLSNAPGG